MILLGDMFDLMFGSVRDAFHASEGLLELLQGKLQGKRFVFLAGNHDHHFVRREAEVLLALELATGKTPVELRGELRQSDLLRRILESRLPGVEVDIRYPTYTFAGVLAPTATTSISMLAAAAALPGVCWHAPCGGSPLAAMTRHRRSTTTRRRSPC